MTLQDIHKIYFLGIGGIGMSALARYFNARGIEIHGYDKTETTLTKKLVDEGMTIHYEEDIKKIPSGIDLVIYTPAIPKTNSELHFLKSINCSFKKRAEVLGMISRAQRTIAVAGTHGKTTTSSILTHILHTGGVDCTAFLGGIAQNFKSNYVEGKGEWVVVEADEYDRSFLQLSPDIAVITNMDADHLDIYDNVEAMHDSGFKEFVKKMKPNGQLFLQHKLTEYFPEKLFETYGIEEGNYRAEKVRVENGWFVFELGEKSDEPLKFSLPGRHNVENAMAAIAVAIQLGVSYGSIKKALETFKGIKRRFEFVYRDEKTILINDYAHHPTELTAAIGAAKELFPNRKIMGIFQPHLYSRTRDFQDGFAAALDGLDEVLLMDIYPAREEPIPGITSEIIFEKMKNPNKDLVWRTNLMNVLKTKDLEVVLTLGAGDINTFVEPIHEYLVSLK
ncbi:MAG: UDP-N-acetylmuramate--L-alanine ligase [Bacteroidetes bacterium]|jgi:UDP-N-acetylmuramate--alanine ligase|nr:UDP-N-acetylmuramate--L-alanine ligase [Bacteroidota bacterium]